MRQFRPGSSRKGIRMKLLSICLLAVIHLSQQRSNPEADTYRAAVVEFASQASNTSQVPINVNGKRYVSFIKQAAASGVDIIVFPEAALTTIHLPQRSDMENWSTLIPVNYNPCERKKIPVHETLKRISCAAREGKIYVVINIAEKLPCDGERCPEDGKFFFNSQAVFDRDGTIIARYRKSHLFNEPQTDILPTPEIVTFDTDFNVTFGTFICFDILFKEPALNLTRIHNVTDIVFSTAWFSELPFLTAIQTHSQWAYAEDVNLLAAGYHRPELASFGSGIYLGRKGIATATIGETGDELLISDVPKKSRQLKSASITDALRAAKSEVDVPEHMHDELRRRRSAKTGQRNDSTSRQNCTVWQDPALLTYETRTMKSIEAHQRLCQRNFCCNFTIEISNIDPTTQYRLMVADNNREVFIETTMGYQACGIVLCRNDSLASCGLLANSETTFVLAKISATFANRENSLILPASVNSSLLPLDWTYQQTIEGDEVHVEAVLNKPSKHVLTLGLFARKFERDTYAPPRALSTRSSLALAIQIGLVILLIIVSIACYLWYHKRCASKRKNEAETVPNQYEHLQQ